jgi:hypothetical protein
VWDPLGRRPFFPTRAWIREVRIRLFNRIRGSRMILACVDNLPHDRLYKPSICALVVVPRAPATGRVPPIPAKVSQGGKRNQQPSHLCHVVAAVGNAHAHQGFDRGKAASNLSGEMRERTPGGGKSARCHGRVVILPWPPAHSPSMEVASLRGPRSASSPVESLSPILQWAHNNLRWPPPSRPRDRPRAPRVDPSTSAPLLH